MLEHLDVSHKKCESPFELIVSIHPILHSRYGQLSSPLSKGYMQLLLSFPANCTTYKIREKKTQMFTSCYSI